MGPIRAFASFAAVKGNGAPIKYSLKEKLDVIPLSFFSLRIRGQTSAGQRSRRLFSLEYSELGIDVCFPI
jgi:hypothetical protein